MDFNILICQPFFLQSEGCYLVIYVWFHNSKHRQTKQNSAPLTYDGLPILASTLVALACAS